jgi:hypothetical protein
MSHPGPDECRARLHAAGWSIGETATAARWVVSGHIRENLISVTGDSQAKTWHRAVEQAEAVGLGGQFIQINRTVWES